MTQEKLPNATAVLVLGILSVIFCWCYGIVGLAMAIVALVLYRKDLKRYEQNPELYRNYGNLSIGRMLSIIGLCLNSLSLIIYIYLIAFVGEQGMREMLHNLEVKAQQQQEQNR